MWCELAAGCSRWRGGRLCRASDEEWVGCSFQLEAGDQCSKGDRLIGEAACCWRIKKISA